MVVAPPTPHKFLLYLAPQYVSTHVAVKLYLVGHRTCTLPKSVSGILCDNRKSRGRAQRVQRRAQQNIN